ncbi:MAG: hypothetical protein AAFZ07_20330 [Actinomycetota bacterium]
MIGTSVETLEKIQDTAVKASGADGKLQVVDLPGPPGTYALVKPSGHHEVRRAEPGARCHQLRSVEEVGGFVTEATERLGGVSPTVWYDEDGVVVVLDDGPGEHREHRCEVVLDWSPEFRLLRALGGLDGGSPRALSQRELIVTLRTRFAACLDDAGRELIRVLRTIRFSDVSGGNATVETGRESLGRDLESEVRSEAGDIPDEVVLDVRIFDDPALQRRQTVRCLLEINTREVTFELLPYGDEVERVIEDQLVAIRTLLEAGLDGIPVYAGRP